MKSAGGRGQISWCRIRLEKNLATYVISHPDSNCDAIIKYIGPFSTGFVELGAAAIVRLALVLVHPCVELPLGLCATEVDLLTFRSRQEKKKTRAFYILDPFTFGSLCDC